jgi:hypothetical protein
MTWPLQAMLIASTVIKIDSKELIILKGQKRYYQWNIFITFEIIPE